nr:putative FAD-binding monooxygenase [uncultured bacterium]
MSDERFPVIVVGGSVVGLTTAAFLSRYGVPVLVVERHPGELMHPRARTINPRSMEVYRQLGLDDRIAAERTYEDDPQALMIRVHTLTGEERSRTRLAADDGGVRLSEFTPSPWAHIDQDRLEVLLRARAEELGADVRFATELVSFEQDDEGVDAVIADLSTGRRRTVRADYLVAADGNTSPVREALGIGRQGTGSLGHMLSMVFEADLRPALAGRRLGICYTEEPTAGTVLLPHDGADRWVFGVPYHPEDGESVDDVDDERVVRMARAAVGDPTLPVRILPQLRDGTKVLGYTIGAAVAERFRAGRCFLVGDAAHVTPPTGAFGASAGIQDAHNLAWKLTAVLRGHAGPGLLDSYDAERRPVADFTLRQAMLQLRLRTGGKLAASAPLEAAADYYAVVCGYRYSSAAVPAEDGEQPFAVPPRDLTGEPGTRAPHVSLEREGTTISTLDLYGGRMVLVCGPEGQVWARAGRRVAERDGFPLAAYTVGTDVSDPGGRWPSAHDVSASGAVLVRPDGFVAWRGATLPDTSPDTVLADVFASVWHRARVAA